MQRRGHGGDEAEAETEAEAASGAESEVTAKSEPEKAAEADEQRIVRRIRVDEGFADDRSVEVVPHEEGALRAGTDIVVVGNRDLEDGDRVQAEPWQTKPVTASDSGEDS